LIREIRLFVLYVISEERTMKKIGILNRYFSAVVAGMGHMDSITVADAGLPVPDGVRRIDLALREGLPGFLETVETLAGELQVEKVVVASRSRMARMDQLHEY
jgi:D-ribose pyranase